jgi:hypothetical protein
MRQPRMTVRLNDHYFVESYIPLPLQSFTKFGAIDEETSRMLV